MSEEKEKVISRISGEIDKIKNGESKILFFVVDTKGNPNGSLAYIYSLALLLKKEGYNVEMLYQEQDEFVGVRDWLGDEYADLPHEDISKGDVSVSASDILFIPELFSNIMMQTKKLPCKRVALLQTYDYVLEQMPMSAQWGDLGIMECLTDSEVNAGLIKELFPYVHTTVVDPFIGKDFGKTSEPKKLIVNIVSKDQSNVSRIIKPFYWKYPIYKFVSFRDLRGFPMETYAKMLREAAVTIYVGDGDTFGMPVLEAMKSGSIVIAKQNELTQEWMKGSEDGVLTNSVVWFDSFHSLSKLLASVIRAFLTDAVPTEMDEETEKTLSLFSEEHTKEQIVGYVKGLLENRLREMESLEKYVEEKKEDTEDGK
jgi:hypothetical protein